jgi:hypothetical protein
MVHNVANSALFLANFKLSPFAPTVISKYFGKNKSEKIILDKNLLRK